MVTDGISVIFIKNASPVEVIAANVDLSTMSSESQLATSRFVVITSLKITGHDVSTTTSRDAETNHKSSNIESANRLSIQFL
jgi:hypothetical protein